jgi:hypothetical protein
MVESKEYQSFGLRSCHLSLLVTFQQLHTRFASSSSSHIVFVIAKLLLRGGASSTHCALATELCDWNHTREVAIAQGVLKPVACGKASSPTQPPPHRMQRHPTKCPFGGKILEACICMQGGCSNHENAF